MRLIDADDLRETILFDNAFSNEVVNYYLDLIDSAETVEIVEPKYGFGNMKSKDAERSRAMLSKEQIAEIEQRAKKATPGPWEYDGMAYVWADGFYIFETRGFGYFTTHGMTKDEAEKQMDSNSIFCSHAREDIPALLEHIRELEAQLAEAQRRAERAIADLKYIAVCETCKKSGVIEYPESAVIQCEYYDSERGCGKYEWRGDVEEGDVK